MQKKTRKIFGLNKPDPQLEKIIFNSQKRKLADGPSTSKSGYFTSQAAEKVAKNSSKKLHNVTESEDSDTEESDQKTRQKISTKLKPSRRSKRATSSKTTYKISSDSSDFSAESDNDWN